jgi:hypothetical protein
MVAMHRANRATWVAFACAVTAYLVLLNLAPDLLDRLPDAARGLVFWGVLVPSVLFLPVWLVLVSRRSGRPADRHD